MIKIDKKILFLIIICFCLIYFIIFLNINEKFDTDKNLFFQPIQNIFLSDNYYNYKLNHPNIKKTPETLGKITFDSFLYSKPTTQKIICSSHTNYADCWEDNVNNCQWVHKIDGNSYCDVGPSIWP